MGFLELNNVSYRYPGQQRQVLNNSNLSIAAKGITAITGANGSGKTTFSKLLVGILKPTAGCIYLQKQLLSSLTLAQIGGLVGYVFQNPDKQLFCETVWKEVAFGLKQTGLPPEQVIQRVQEILTTFDLERYASAFPLQLSLGEKRRLVIAAVLALEPQLVVMDEPTTGLDAHRQRIVGEALEKIVSANRGVIIISHDQQFIARYASRVIRLENGQFVEG